MKIRIMVLGLLVCAPVAFADSQFDAQLREVIEERFYNDARVQSYDINVETNNSDVVLRGTVTSLEERAAAIKIATATPGVRSLKDELTVRPPRRSDNALRSEALSAIRNRGEISGTRAVVQVRKQVVTLGGTFPTLAAIDRVVESLTQIRGVRDIRITAEVQPTVRISDEHIRTAIAQSLLGDSALNARKIEVGVRDGRVVLAGEVASLFEMVRAVEIARQTTGVRTVTNAISLQPQGIPRVG